MGEHKNFMSREAIEKVRELVDGIHIGMLCTKLDETPISTCPMARQEVDDKGNIWFFSTSNSEHNRNIKQDSRAQLIFSDPSGYNFLSLYGYAEIRNDRRKIEELWAPDAKIWFPEGKDDPNLTLLCFTPAEGYYWDTKNNKMVAFLKMAASLVTGQTMDDSVEGRLDM